MKRFPSSEKTGVVGKEPFSQTGWPQEDPGRELPYGQGCGLTRPATPLHTCPHRLRLHLPGGRVGPGTSQPQVKEEGVGAPKPGEPAPQL